jgi:hypothetical protein
LKRALERFAVRAQERLCTAAIPPLHEVAPDADQSGTLVHALDAGT